MKIIRLPALLLSACWCLLPALSSAETHAPEGVVDATSINNDLEKYSRLLDSDRFSERRLASQELSAAGIEALPVLEKAALGDSREASARAMTIIQQHFEAGDEDTRKEAEAFLKRIAESGNDFAARRAQESLAPEEMPPNQFNPVFGNIAPQQRAAIAQARAAQIQRMQIQVARQQQAIQRINVRVANGEKTITVTEKDRKVSITEKKNEVEVVVTEKKDGKDKTTKYTAKDADDLKKKHPEAHAIYKKYNRGPGIQLNAQIRINGLPQ